MTARRGGSATGPEGWICPPGSTGQRRTAQLIPNIRGGTVMASWLRPGVRPGDGLAALAHGPLRREARTSRNAGR